jgi:hypothetical protein
VLPSVIDVSTQSDLDPTGLRRESAAAGLGYARRAPDAGAVPVIRSAPAVPRYRDSSSIWAFTTRHSVGLACVATLAAHLLSLARQLGPDEGGFAMVAQHWLDGGPYLYGAQWVDRPPGLIALFWTAQHLGPYGVRLVASVLAVALVAALAWAADAVGGRPAARWAAWAGFAFGSSVLFQAQQLNGELAAATFVAVSVAALLRAVRVSTNRAQTVLLGVLAGGSASVAVLMKQNFVDAFVFAAVLLTVGVATRTNRLTYRPGTVLTSVVGFTAGAGIPAVIALAWASGHGGPGALFYAMYGFRSDAAAVMANWSWAAPQHRLEVLGQLALMSGLLVLLLHLAFNHRKRLRRTDPLPWAISAAAGVEVFGVVAGENFWPHYLIALIPMVALAAGLSVNRRTPGWRWTRLLVVAAATATAVVTPVTALGAMHHTDAAYTTGRWIAASAQPGDTLVVPFTHANVIDAAGLTPGYPYSWSLPVRTLDPNLALLTGTLSGPAAPTWVVRWDHPHTWGLDPDSQVDAALRARYRSVAVVCGHTVWLHDGVSRQLTTTPPSSACGAGEG